MMNQSQNSNESGESWNEILLAFTALFLCALIMVVLIFVPILAGRSWHPWIGVGLSIAALPAWLYLGPPPSPGFGSGVLCISGMFLLLGMVISNIIFAFAGV
jgi:hypothetical protein